MKAELLGRGRPIPDFDLGIAATSLATGRILVSGDRHMSEVQGLRLENWTAGGLISVPLALERLAQRGGGW